ncbi:MAG: metal-dependent transcriptional regulator [Clostridia bacterium]|nr:metal-dependent transcriptional regulator [Clostridia bacterium]MBR4458554.1 metal-dependent transcriptional regulator [Clostridia bacterium]
MKQTRSVEDYLEAILMIQQEKGICRSIDVATHLNYSKPSVSVAMHNLENDGSITRAADGSLLLTDKGLAIAKSVLDRHRFLTSFFREIGVDPVVAEQDACGMEHSISEESFSKLRAWYEATHPNATEE